MTGWDIGDVRITKVVELEAAGGLEFLLPQATPDALLEIDWLRPQFIDERGRLVASVHALLIAAGSRRIVVDTCLGHDKQQRPVPGWNGLRTPFLRDLERAGFAREAVDTVICTHLHIDHVGWNTMLVDGRWVPTFPNARYLIVAPELAYWRDQTEDPGHVVAFADSVRPVVDAGLVDLVPADHVVCDQVRLEPTRGHTPGHVSVRIASRGEEALITGDFLHHPCQMAHPEWAATVDYDRAVSTATRHEVFGRLAGTATLLIGTHFAGPTAGRVVRDGAAYRLVA